MVCRLSHAVVDLANGRLLLRPAVELTQVETSRSNVTTRSRVVFEQWTSKRWPRHVASISSIIGWRTPTLARQLRTRSPTRGASDLRRRVDAIVQSLAALAWQTRRAVASMRMMPSPTPAVRSGDALFAKRERGVGDHHAQALEDER